ncbi:unnamed protein product [Urochloa humidicola]
MSTPLPPSPALAVLDPDGVYCIDWNLSVPNGRCLSPRSAPSKISAGRRLSRRSPPPPLVSKFAAVRDPRRARHQDSSRPSSFPQSASSMTLAPVRASCRSRRTP